MSEVWLFLRTAIMRGFTDGDEGEAFDLFIDGGGISGTCVAYVAAYRGLSVVKGYLYKVRLPVVSSCLA